MIRDHLCVSNGSICPLCSAKIKLVLSCYSKKKTFSHIHLYSFDHRYKFSFQRNCITMLILRRQIIYIAMNMVAMNTASTIGCIGHQFNTQ